MKGILHYTSLSIGNIVDYAPATKLPPSLTRFAVGTVDDFAGAHQYIIELMAEMSVSEACDLQEQIEAILKPISRDHYDRLFAQWEADAAVAEADLDVLATAFTD